MVQAQYVRANLDLDALLVQDVCFVEVNGAAHLDKYDGPKPGE